MLVCHCRRVTDRQVREAIDCGARTLDDVSEQCGAAQQCGGCEFAVTNLLSTALATGAGLLDRDSESRRVTAAA
jgi:bacterioferritin-associated ferredoxin